MGFEIYYHYNEKLDGKYDEEIKILKKRVGDPFEDVSLEKLASSITAQLARRDIFISEVEIYELSKKKISFKETKGGIVIKNKKFLFDGTETSLSFIEETCSEETSCATNKKLCSEKIIHPHESLSKEITRRPIDVAVFAPEPQQMPDVKKRNLNLTVDKRYEVFEKKQSPNGIGEVYLVIDDKNKEQLVPDLYFIPASVNLFGDRELGFSNSMQKDNGNLLWGDAKLDPGMPDIRRK